MSVYITTRDGKQIVSRDLDPIYLARRYDPSAGAADMLIGPVYDTAGKTLYAILVHLGPGSDEGKALDVSGTTPAWNDYDTESIEDFRLILTENNFDGESWSIYSASVSTTVPKSQKCRAVIYDDADGSHVATVDVGDPGRSAIGEHRKIAPSNTFRLGRRRDGTTTAWNSIRIRPGEILACCFDVSELTDAEVVSIANLAVDTTDELTVSKLNDESVLGMKAKFEADATDAVDTSDYVITATILTEDGDYLEAEGTIECRA